ncbi:uncharacterized protein [Musca autumnalis]|uniref:uncharacterized protein n=1 Tax=Musca autumnalis TaxID=221902 RepID=UPI003CE6F8B2
MPTLGDYDVIRNNLSTSKRTITTALHKFIFGEEGDRSNRKRLRNFEGFEYAEDSAEYQEKVKYIKQNLSTADLVSICNLLCLSYDVEDLCAHIFSNLKKGMLLTNDVDVESQADDDEAENEVDDAESLTNDDEPGSTSDNDLTMVPRKIDDNDVNTVSQNLQSRVRMGNNNFSNGNEEGRQHILKQQQPTNKVHSEDYENNKENIATAGQYNQSLHVPKFAMNFRDIEDTIRNFDGSKNLSIRSWLDEFEDNARVMCWDQFQMFIFAKRSLKGLAKLFISSERGITSYNQLKRALLDEFDTVVNSCQLHKMLMERKMLKNESIQEYFLHMREIASRGSIEDKALMQYVIEGIKDSTVNKTILFGAENINEFKKKLRCYEMMQSSTVKKEYVTPVQAKMPNKTEKTEMKCYNCGAKGHTSKKCPNAGKGLKCFNCNNYGHISKDCPSKQNEKVRRINSDKDMMINVKFKEENWFALFDTGSKFNIVTENVYKVLNKPELTKTNFYLVGFGNNKIKPMGCFEHEVEIDGEKYRLCFQVVPATCIDVDVIIGKEFCSYAEVNITPERIQFRKVKDYECEDVYSMMALDIWNGANDTDIDIGETASDDAKEKVLDMINNYRPEKTKGTNVEMRITLSQEDPIFCNPRRLPLTERYIVDDQIDKWMAEDIIEVSNSEFCSPVVLTKKRDGTHRLCIDYRKINKVIVKDHFPLPLIEDQLDRLQDATVFSTIDLRNGFFHVPVNEESQQMKSFNKLKEMMANQPVLNIFNQKYETELHTDASIDGYGAVLLQKSPDDGLLHPVYFMSRKTTEQERKYSSYELEVLAIVEALRKFRVYLIGLKFKLVTDCNAFTKTIEKKDIPTRVARWIMLLQEYDFYVEHRPGNQMRHVDALSRHPVMFIGEDSLTARIKQLQQHDGALKAIRHILNDQTDYDGYFMKGGVLYKFYFRYYEVVQVCWRRTTNNKLNLSP